MPRNITYLVDANKQRHSGGAARQVERARAALPKLEAALPGPHRLRTEPVMARYRGVVSLRIRYPKATVAELAELAGMSKGRFWSILRRALITAEKLP
jgi:hypothetical protein